MSLFDLSFAVAQFATDSIVVRRYNATTHDSFGRLNPKSFTDTTTTGSVQPLSGRDLSRLPEGFDSNGVVSVWALAQLAVADRLSIGGRVYQVESVQEWSASGNYTKAMARELASRENFEVVSPSGLPAPVAIGEVDVS